jgi:hypothetical protein
VIGIIFLIVWFVISALLITFFSIEWSRTLVYMLAEGFGYDAVRVDQTVELDPIIKQFPYVLSLGSLVVSIIIFNYRYVCAGTRRFGRDARAAWGFVSLCGREHVANNRTVMMGLCVVTLVGLSLRLIYLNEPIRGDEAYTFTQYAQRPLFLGLTQYYIPNNHLLNTILVHFSYLSFGNQPWVLRLPVLIAGTLAVPIAYVVFSRLYKPVVGLLTAAFISSSAPLIEYSVNARGYMLMLSIFLSMLALATFLRGSYNRFGWALFIVLGVLGFCALPIMVYPCGIISGWLLLNTHYSATKHQIKFVIAIAVSMSLIAALTAMIYWPVLVVSGYQEVLGNYYTISHSQFFGGLFSYVKTLSNIWFDGWPQVIGWGVLMCAISRPLVASVVGKPNESILLVTVACVTVLLLARPVLGYPRLWLFILPILLGEAAAGFVGLVEYVTRRQFKYATELMAALALILALMLGGQTVASETVRYSRQTGTLLGGEKVAKWLLRHANKSDVVTSSNYSSASLRYYLDQNGALLTLTWSVSDMLQSERIFIVVNTLYGENSSSLVESRVLKDSAFGEPRLLERWRETDLYVMLRTDSS